VDVDKAPHWNSRGHFFVAAAEAMRRILIQDPGLYISFLRLPVPFFRPILRAPVRHTAVDVTTRKTAANDLVANPFS
jgi:hypothetical protein